MSEWLSGAELPAGVKLQQFPIFLETYRAVRKWTLRILGVVKEVASQTLPYTLACLPGPLLTKH